MEIDLRIADDYCQGDALTLIPQHEIDWDDEDRVKSKIKIKSRHRLTQTDQ